MRWKKNVERSGLGCSQPFSLPSFQQNIEVFVFETLFQVLQTSMADGSLPLFIDVPGFPVDKEMFYESTPVTSCMVSFARVKKECR